MSPNLNAGDWHLWWTVRKASAVVNVIYRMGSRGRHRRHGIVVLWRLCCWDSGVCEWCVFHNYLISKRCDKLYGALLALFRAVVSSGGRLIIQIKRGWKTEISRERERQIKRPGRDQTGAGKMKTLMNCILFFNLHSHKTTPPPSPAPCFPSNKYKNIIENIYI